MSGDEDGEADHENDDEDDEDDKDDDDDKDNEDDDDDHNEDDVTHSIRTEVSHVQKSPQIPTLRKNSPFLFKSRISAHKAVCHVTLTSCQDLKRN